MYGACDRLVLERDPLKELRQLRRTVLIDQQVLALDASFQIDDASQVFRGEYRMHPSNHHESTRRLVRIPNLQRL